MRHSSQGNKHCPSPSKHGTVHHRHLLHPHTRGEIKVSLCAYEVIASMQEWELTDPTLHSTLTRLT